MRFGGPWHREEIGDFFIALAKNKGAGHDVQIIWLLDGFPLSNIFMAAKSLEVLVLFPIPCLNRVQ